jgi:hypothetical protein
MGFVNYIVYNFWENLIFLWFKRYIWKQEGSCTWASERGCTGCRVSHALVYIYQYHPMRYDHAHLTWYLTMHVFFFPDFVFFSSPTTRE